MSDTDPTAPWFEFLSYCRCCDSLGVKPSMNRFLAYQKYYGQFVAKTPRT